MGPGLRRDLIIGTKSMTVEPLAASTSETAKLRETGEPLLQTENLTIRSGGLTALDNVNVAVARGQVRAIIGPNGAGKSTFFNCVTGVLRPSSGHVLFNGEDITGLPPNRISQKGIARSYQITNILPNATVLENARIAAQSRRHAWSLLTHHRAYRDIIDKAESVLEQVGLLGKADELAANLSHGEQRNLEIGIALATEPQLLCLDEPTAGMSAAETHETMGLLGRNGVGKSTTLKAIAGLVHPSAGRVSFEGREITGLAAHRLARLGIGYVPEDRRIFRLLTVTENLRTGLDRHGMTAARKKQLLDKVHAYFPVLAERRNQAGGTLSGGEQQMLAIARAMMLEPKIILLDEPTEGLMPRMVSQIRAIIDVLHEERVAVLLVEQNVPLTLEVGQRIYFMEKGAIRHHAVASTLKVDDPIIHQYLGV